MKAGIAPGLPTFFTSCLPQQGWTLLLPTTCGFMYFFITFSLVNGCFVGSLPWGDLVPAAEVVHRIIAVAVLGGVVGCRVFAVVGRAAPEVLDTSLTVLPSVVPGIEAVGDHQFRQTRGMRVVTLGAGEGVIADICRSGIDRDPPVKALIGVVSGNQRIELDRPLTAVQVPPGRARRAVVVDVLYAHVRHICGSLCVIEQVCPGRRRPPADAVTEDIGRGAGGAAQGRIAVAIGADPEVLASRPIHGVHVAAVAEGTETGRGRQRQTSGGVAVVLVDLVAALLVIKHTATRHHTEVADTGISLVPRRAVLGIRVANPGAAQIGLTSHGIAGGLVEVMDVVAVGAADVAHGVLGFGVGFQRTGDGAGTQFIGRVGRLDRRLLVVEVGNR